ncbi:hypothetical protein, partial [Vibrio cholerae]|uniref:hypothetical protein n=1 Tax=Vibrio cholerae TaxID=666 RepID=UPI001C10988D
VELRKSGKLPHCMIGHSAFFLASDIDNLLDSHFLAIFSITTFFFGVAILLFSYYFSSIL